MIFRNVQALRNFLFSICNELAKMLCSRPMPQLTLQEQHTRTFLFHNSEYVIAPANPMAEAPSATDVNVLMGVEIISLGRP